jgi:hypothetical protein
MSIYIVCVVLLFASQEVAAADEIVLSDGTRLAGTLLS